MNRLAKMIQQFFLLLVAVLLPLILAQSAVATTTPKQVKEFIHNVYIEGVPYEQASQLSAEVALPVLKEVLNDPREEDYWANVVVTIGMIGNDQGVKLLTDFIARKEAKDKLNRAQTVAKTSAVMALGYIVNKTSNRNALDFLVKGIDPQIWNKHNIMWTGEFHLNKERRNEQLASMAILGLGISGNAEAAKILQSLSVAPITERMRTLKKAMPEIDNIAAVALEANRAISIDGLKNYYQKIQPKHAPDENRANVKSQAEFEMTKPPVAGEILKQPQLGEVLRQPQQGEVVSPEKKGEVIKPLQKGEIIKVR